jgi:hypothetical protein
VSGVFAVALLTANFSAYPGYGDKGTSVPKGVEKNHRIEATIDRGPIAELIIKCHTGTTIISYSKVERLFCSPKRFCDRQLARVVEKSCG